MKKRWIFAALVAIFALAMFGCKNEPDDPVTEKKTPAVTSVTITPTTASVDQGGTQQFTVAVAAVNGASNAYTLDVAVGTGANAAGSVASGTTFTSNTLTIAGDQATGTLQVTATSTFDSTKKATATVTVLSAFSVTLNLGGAVYGGSETPTLYYETTSGATFDYSTLTSLNSDLTNGTLTLDGWYNGATKVTADFTVSGKITLVAYWKSNVANPESVVTTVALGNGGHTAFQFQIPPGGRFDDYVAIGWDVKVLSTVTLNLGESANGYGQQQISNIRLKGPLPREAFTDVNEDNTLASYVANLNSWNVPFHAAYLPSSAYYGTGDPIVPPTPDANGYLNLQFGLTAGSGGVAAVNQPQGKTYAENGPSGFTTEYPQYADKTIWPSAGDPGPFFFALGIAGQAGTVIIQEIKNVRLIPDSSATGVDPVYSTGFGDDKPAFVSYITDGALKATYGTDDGDMWSDNGDSTKTAEAPKYVIFHNGEDHEGTAILGGKVLWAKPGTSITPPTVTNAGSLFTGWFDAITGGTEVDDFSNITADLQVYAQWEEDTDFVADPDWDDASNLTYDLGTWDFENDGGHTNQRGWATKGAQVQISSTDTPIVTNLELADLQNALYIVLEITDNPTGTGSLAWQTGSQWSGTGGGDVWGNFGTTPTPPAATQYVNLDQATGKKIVIKLSSILNGFDLAGQTNPVRIGIQYWGASGHSLADLGVTNAFLVFKSDYTITSDPDDE